MISFCKGEPVSIPNSVVMEGGEFEDLDLVKVCKWDNQEEEYTRVQAYFLKFGSWK